MRPHVIAAAANCRYVAPWDPRWTACLKAGWHQPTTNAANLGFAAGHNVAPWAIAVGIIIGLLWIISRGRSGKPATN